MFEEFKAFVRAKPPREVFNSRDGQTCAIAQFAQAKYPGAAIHAGYTSFTLDDVYIPLIEEDNFRFDLYNVVYESRTFGQLSKRLEALHV